jgi:hypothetical protein
VLDYAVCFVEDMRQLQERPMKYISGLLCGASLAYLFRVTLSGGQVILLLAFGLLLLCAPNFTLNGGNERGYQKDKTSVHWRKKSKSF